MKKTFCLLIVLASVLSMCACINIGGDRRGNSVTVQAPAASPEPAEGSFIFTAENMPVIGCTKAYEALAYAFAGAALNTSGEILKNYVCVGRSMADCYAAFTDGKTNILLAPAPDKKMSETAYSKDFLWTYTPLGRDALVFICYRGNALDNISLLNLRYLYQACFDNWSQLGGYDEKMHIYGENEGSAGRMMFDSLFGVPEENVQTEMIEYYDTAYGLVGARASYTKQKGSIGYSTYNYCVHGTDGVLSYSKMLSLDGVKPERQSIYSGTYPFVADFGVLINEKAQNGTSAGIFYEWMCSEQGKQLVSASGY